MRHRIVLATLGSLGDLNPMLGLALELQRRGDRPLVATSEFYRPRIESAGIEFSSLRPLASPDDAQLVRQVMDSRRGPEFLIRTLLLPHLREMYDDLAIACRDADFLIAGEIVFAAPLLAQVRNLPWAGAVLAPLSFFSASDPSVLPQLPFAAQLGRAPTFIQRMLLGLVGLATHGWSEPVRSLRRELGLPATVQPMLRDRFSPYLNLALFSAVMGEPQPDWPANTVQTGFVQYDSPHEEPAGTDIERFLSSGTAPIVFTLGSAAVLLAEDFFEESVKAARALGRRAVLVMGNNPRPAMASQDVLTLDYAAYSRLFSAAACVVHQGGIGTTARALAAGVPQLVVPYAFDQPDNAARVVRLGVGQQVSRKRYRSAHVANLLGQLLNRPSYARAAADVKRRVRAQDGAAAACVAIERYLRSVEGPAPKAVLTVRRTWPTTR